MTKLTNYCTGFLLLKLSGQNQAAFISECARQGIPQWGVRHRGGHVLLCSTVRGFLSMRNPARKHRCQVEGSKQVESADVLQVLRQAGLD